MSDALDRFRTSITAEKQKATYDELARKYGVNRWYLWYIINDPDYEPSAKIAVKLGIAEFITIKVDRGTDGRFK